ncbi:proline iminopeptidase-family hydrolase [Rhodospirillum sp. A1_3_36]|uniref:proline iminopeptidase-family hydrolase n=1 Tax=Rhodospirillum sp. A1_3_36 TaxID=3391666 RepID=UPI0039A6B9D8
MSGTMATTGLLANGFRVWSDRAADEVTDIPVQGHRVRAYSYGDGEEVLFCLNGGPGLPCDYLRDPHVPLTGAGYRVVSYDQLGTGASDHPTDPALWTIERYADEVEAVLQALGLEKVHFLGHSWGGWCGIEYAHRYPQRIKSMILANTCADIPHLMGEIEGLRNALGSETVAMMQRYEALGTYDHPAYKAAITLLDYRHIRRLPERPIPAARSNDGFNQDIYRAVQGPNEYHYIGNLIRWSRLKELEAFDWPTLILNGQHDVLTPACGRLMHQAIPGSEIRIFQNSSHSPFFEEPEAYRATLLDFLGRACGHSSGFGS